MKIVPCVIAVERWHHDTKKMSSIRTGLRYSKLQVQYYDRILKILYYKLQIRMVGKYRAKYVRADSTQWYSNNQHQMVKSEYDTRKWLNNTKWPSHQSLVICSSCCGSGSGCHCDGGSNYNSQDNSDHVVFGYNCVEYGISFTPFQSEHCLNGTTGVCFMAVMRHQAHQKQWQQQQHHWCGKRRWSTTLNKKKITTHTIRSSPSTPIITMSHLAPLQQNKSSPGLTKLSYSSSFCGLCIIWRWQQWNARWQWQQ